MLGLVPPPPRPGLSLPPRGAFPEEAGSSAPPVSGAPRGLDNPGAPLATPSRAGRPRNRCHAALPLCFSSRGVAEVILEAGAEAGAGGPASSPWGSGAPRSPQPAVERDASVAQVSDAGGWGADPSTVPLLRQVAGSLCVLVS